MKIEDRELALQAREGNHEALSELVWRLRMPLFRLAYSELHHYDDAQDAVATSLLQIVLHIGDLRDAGALWAWCSKIVKNEARRLRRDSRRSIQTPLDTETPAEEIFRKSHLRLDIERSLDRLPQDQARSLWFFYINGLSVDQISQRSGAPAGTIKYWLHQGRSRLASEMKGYQPVKTRTGQRKAAIISTSLGQEMLDAMENSFQDAGWSQVVRVGDFASAGQVETALKGETAQLHLPAALAGCDCILIDEWIGGRPSFELIALYNVCAERESAKIFCLIGDKTSNPSLETSVHAAYALGVDILLTKPFEGEEFRGLVKRIHSRRWSR